MKWFFCNKKKKGGIKGIVMLTLNNNRIRAKHHLISQPDEWCRDELQRCRGPYGGGMTGGRRNWEAHASVQL